MKDLLNKFPRKTGKLQETALTLLEKIRKPYLALMSWLNYQDQSTVLNFRDIVEDAKIEAGLNQVQMAEILGVEKGTLSKWLKSPPRYYKVQKLLGLAKTKPVLAKPELSKRHISRKFRLTTGICIFIALTLLIGILLENTFAIQQHTGSWSPWSIFDTEE